MINHTKKFRRNRKLAEGKNKRKKEREREERKEGKNCCNIILLYIPISTGFCLYAYFNISIKCT
jgi:hypothetical protein